MTAHLTFSETMPPQEAGLIIAEQFAEGESVIWAQGLGFNALDPATRAAYITEFSGALGKMTLTNGAPGTELWLLDSSTSPNAARIPFHTDNPFYEQPEPIVSFWNLRSSASGGENILLKVDDLLDWADGEPEHAETLERLKVEHVPFSLGEHTASGAMLDEASGTARYDQKYISPASAPLGKLFTHMLADDTLPTHAIKLEPGDALFFDNQRTLHSRAPYSDPTRQSIRVRLQPHEQES